MSVRREEEKVDLPVRPGTRRTAANLVVCMRFPRSNTRSNIYLPGTDILLKV